MTEHDGLTDARAEAERLYPMPSPMSRKGGRIIASAKRVAFIEGAELATEREKARAEAAEAALRAIRDGAFTCADLPRCGKGRHDPQCAKAIATNALTASTTEAVTEVEGS